MTNAKYLGLTANQLAETASKLEAENAKLREEIKAAKHDLQMFSMCYVQLDAKNAKLRELVRDMWRDIPKSEVCAWDSSSNTCIGSDSCIGECSYWYRMVKLGIEVDE